MNKIRGIFFVRVLIEDGRPFSRSNVIELSREMLAAHPNLTGIPCTPLQARRACYHLVRRKELKVVAVGRPGRYTTRTGVFKKP